MEKRFATEKGRRLNSPVRSWPGPSGPRRTVRFIGNDLWRLAQVQGASSCTGRNLGYRLLTTVQDLGRFGYQRLGIPAAGAMDTFALRAASALVGNDQGAACLECTLVGPRVLHRGLSDSDRGR